MTEAEAERLHARLIMAREFVATGRGVDAYRAVCQFEAEKFYAQQPEDVRRRLWAKAMYDGHERLAKWLIKTELRLFRCSVYFGTGPAVAERPH
jgi:hypothetical protein